MFNATFQTGPSLDCQSVPLEDTPGEVLLHHCNHCALCSVARLPEPTYTPHRWRGSRRLLALPPMLPFANRSGLHRDTARGPRSRGPVGYCYPHSLGITRLLLTYLLPRGVSPWTTRRSSTRRLHPWCCLRARVCVWNFLCNLLWGGNTAHSTLIPPLKLNHIRTPLCTMSKKSDITYRLKIDCLRKGCHGFQGRIRSFDKTLENIRSSKHLMSVVTVISARGFRQTLSLEECVLLGWEWLKSHLWPKIHVLSLWDNE